MARGALQVAADWHELLIPQHIMWTSIAHPRKQLDHSAASRHIIATICHTKSSPSFPIPLRVVGVTHRYATKPSVGPGSDETNLDFNKCTCVL